MNDPNGMVFYEGEHPPTGTIPVHLKDGQPTYDITKDVAFDYITYTDFLQHLF